MLRLLHTADLHLDAPFPALGERAEPRRADFLKTFERLVNLAIKSEVRLFLVAGDLFDGPRPAPTVVSQVQAGFKRLVDRGIRPVLLPGTHDSIVLPDSVYRRETFPGAVVLAAPQLQEPVRLEIDGSAVHLYGFAYAGSQSEEALAGMRRRTEAGLHIGLLHGSRIGSPEWDYRKKDLPFDLARLQEWDLDYVALGHYHAFEEFEHNGRCFACYPGSPEGKRFGENGPRHAALVTVGPRQARIEKCAVNSRNLDERELDLSGCPSPADAAAAVLAQGQPELLLRLTLTGIVETPLPLEPLRESCRGAFFHLDLVDRTRLFDSALAQRIAHEETVRGVFVRRLQRLLQEAPPEQRATLEAAFREVMVRFVCYGGRS